MKNESPQILVAIVDRNKQQKLENLLEEKHVPLLYLINGTGTAGSDIKQAFGFSGTDKTIALCMVGEGRMLRLMTAIIDRMELSRPGHGIIFSISVTANSGAITRVLECGGEVKVAGLREKRKNNQKYQLQKELMQKDIQKELIQEEMVEEFGVKYELVIAIVSHGYSEEVMDAAKSAGARGGTVIHARQAALAETVKFFGIHIQPEKEMVLIVIESEHMENVMQSIVKSCGKHTEARALVMSLSLDKCAGITPIT